MAHGTLHRALGRLERAGLLESQWDDADVAAAADRPRRRLYVVTLAGARAVAEAHAAGLAPVAPARHGQATA
jgi:PadR family transcriptional regulator